MWTVTSITGSSFTMTRNDSVTLVVTIPSVGSMNKRNILDFLRNYCDRYDRGETTAFTDLQSLVGTEL